jgi:uncharacterized membrane protein YphA (DoxX/SURF4 family)
MGDFLKRNFLKDVDGFALGLFRAIFGAFMVYEISFFQSAQFVEIGILAPFGTFEYDFFEWVQPLSLSSMKLVMFLLFVSAVCITLGLLFRPAAIIFTILFTYLLFLGKGHYNNHFYLFCLIPFYLIFTKADRNFSLRSFKKNPDVSRDIPYWNYQVLRLQLFIAYFYGGLSKLNSDWMNCKEPINTIVRLNFPDSILSSDFMVNFLNYGGVFFDLGIGFLLLFRKTRWFAFFGVITFNLLNGLVLFDDIGIFPFVMIFATIVFFDPEEEWIQKLKSVFISGTYRDEKKERQFSKMGAALTFLSVFLFLQLLIPLRFMALDGNTNWTGIGRKFSWRMKIQTRQLTQFKMKAVNKKTGQLSGMDEASLLKSKFVNTLQYRYMRENPVMIWQFAQYLNKKNLEDTGTELELYFNVKVEYNGREEQLIIDPEVDLVAAKYDPLGTNDWIMPLEGSCD